MSRRAGFFNGLQLAATPYVVVAAIVLRITLAANAQEKVEAQHIAGGFDSSYVASYNAYFMPRFLLSRKYNRVQVTDRVNDYSLVFIPNKTVNAGIGATYKFATLNISTTLIPPDESRGRTRNLDLQINSYGRRYTTDLLFQSYRGYYLRDQRYAPLTDQYYIRPDLRCNTVGVSVQHVFNHRRFSYRAAFQQTEWQKKSAGTVLSGIEIYAGRFKGDSAIAPAQVRAELTGEASSMMRFFEIGPNAGYAYTWVYKRFFITGSASAGLNFGVTSYFGENSRRKVTGLTPNTMFRISTGYNSGSWAANLLFISRALHLPRLDDQLLVISTGNIRMNLIYRIKPGRRLKKAVRVIEKVDRELKR